MSARIMIDLDRVYPVFGGRWHRLALRQRVPQPGELITIPAGRSMKPST